ncbi:MAG: hypothetical protein COA42_17110 [Alteromonadaceae bacterium]|nr:MAG: hypothetical protein COA42_17110 [Alteromonadaceae bacterium]
MSLTGCSDSIKSELLVNGLNKHKLSLEPVAEALIIAGDGAILDLRDTPLRIYPDDLEGNISDAQLSYLSDAGISFAAYDKGFGGVVFEVVGRGIGISGSSSGYVFQRTHSKSVDMVDDLQRAFDERKASLKDGDSLNVRLVQEVSKHWGIYLETF